MISLEQREATARKYAQNGQFDKLGSLLEWCENQVLRGRGEYLDLGLVVYKLGGRVTVPQDVLESVRGLEWADYEDMATKLSRETAKRYPITALAVAMFEALEIAQINTGENLEGSTL